jgi:AraC-like DNA-binding protein
MRREGARKGKSHKATSVIAALVARAEDRFALRRELRTLGETKFPRDAAALLSLVRASPVRLVIAEPRDPKSNETAPAIRTIRATWPSIPILVLCDLTADDVHLLVDLVRSGADDAIVRSVDRIAGAAASLLARGAMNHMLVQALDEIRDVASPDARSILAYSIEYPAARRPVQQIATALGVSRRTLVNRLTSVGLPGPSVFVAWGRLLVAASSLEDPTKSVRDVARTLGLRSNAGLHMLCRRHSRLSVRELRRGGSSAVLDQIRRELRSARRRAG